MRVITVDERNALAASHHELHVRLLVENPDGVMTHLAGPVGLFGQDWFRRARWEENIDRPVIEGTIVLAREIAGASLAPDIGASAANRTSGGAYAPFLDIARKFVLQTCVTLPGVAPAAFRPVLEGRIDGVDVQDDEITLRVRDYGGRIVDAEIETSQVYGSPAGVPIETVIQQLLNDTLGVGTVTLYTPVSPGIACKEFRQDTGKLMEAVRALALQIGWDLRYRYDAADVSRFTFMEVPRSKTIPDATIGPDEYALVPGFARAITDVRNAVTVHYYDVGTGAKSQHSATDLASQNKYGRRWMEIGEEATSAINSDAMATAMCNAALSDLSAPKTDQAIGLRHWWPAQLFDLYSFLANDVHYDSDQALAVVNVTHEIDDGGGQTTIATRGTVAGAYRTWHRLPGAPDLDTEANVTNATWAADGSTATVTAVVDEDAAIGADRFRWRVDGGAWVLVAIPATRVVQFTLPFSSTATQLVEVQAQNAASQWGPSVALALSKYDAATAGPSLNVVPTPGASSYTIAYTYDGTLELRVDGVLTTPPASPIVVSRPAAGGVPKVYSFKCTKSGQFITDELTVPPIDADTVTPDPVLTMGTPTATTVPFTASATNPKTGDTLYLNIYFVGCSGTVNGTPVGDGGYIGVLGTATIIANRPPLGGAQGTLRVRVGSGTGWAEISRSVVPQGKDFTPPTFDVSSVSTSTAVSITYSSSGTVTYRVDNGAWAAAPASPFSVARNAAGGADRTVQIKATGSTGIEVGPVSIAVPAQSGSGPSLPRSINQPIIGTPDVSGNYFPVSWTSDTGLPSGGRYNLRYSDDGGNSYTEPGFVGNVTSPKNFTEHGYDISAGTTFTMTVYIEMWDADSNIVAQSPPAQRRFGHF